MSSPSTVVDTVVLRYFLLVERTDLLIDLLGAPLAVPRVVFDPDDDDAKPQFKSELRRSVDYQLVRSRDQSVDDDEREASRVRAARLAGVEDLVANGNLEVLDLTDSERAMVGQLTSPSGCKAFNLRFPLDPGEAACLAIAVERGLVIATDDSDALRARSTLANPPNYERIRKLLIRSAAEGLVTEVEANEIHQAMRDHGFWDDEPPFPTE